ncbi:MAG: hypothetical protein GY820_19730 [Gammaproteobacteria bacterium]|nr:hypothetical protein [Gammaproteobacteria bacterium]
MTRGAFIAKAMLADQLSRHTMQILLSCFAIQLRPRRAPRVQTVCLTRMYVECTSAQWSLCIIIRTSSFVDFIADFIWNQAL